MRRLLLPLLLFPPAACSSTPDRGPGDATVQLHTRGGGELGVSTDFGVVFLGQGAQSGEVEFTVWFTDGPSREQGIIEPLGGTIYLTQAVIQLPTATLSFADPGPGTPVLVRGRRKGAAYELPTEIAGHPAVEGVILRTDAALRDLGPDQVGAGVYMETDEGTVLVGLISGSLTLPLEGGTREYLSVVGTRDLWRIVTHHRNLGHPRPRVYRDDLL